MIPAGFVRFIDWEYRPHAPLISRPSMFGWRSPLPR